MGARSTNIEPDRRLVVYLARILERGSLLDAYDVDQKVVRAQKYANTWAIYWDNEPGWAGDSISIARLFLRVLGPSLLFRVVD